MSDFGVLLIPDDFDPDRVETDEEFEEALIEAMMRPLEHPDEEISGCFYNKGIDQSE